MTFQRFALIVASAVAFLVGYGTAAEAWPGVPDRGRWHGYFRNIEDDQGYHVILNGYPSWVDSANEFISFTENRLYGGSARDRTGAAFIIQTMLGDPWNRNRPPTADQMADWRSRVIYAGNNRWIGWNNWFTYTANSYWQGDAPGGSNPDDDAFYYEDGIKRAITFSDATGRVVYVIKRDCANPLGNGFMPGLSQLWNTRGHTDVAPTAMPGQTVTFRHYLENFGETAARVWYVTNEAPGRTATTGLPSLSGSNMQQPGVVLNVRNENFTIPASAAAGARYCRFLEWDPANSWGGRNRDGTPGCVTVEIPAKLKAAMSASPKPIAPGDVATFTPSISATSNASPVTVQCDIQRVLYPPAGGSSSLGSQPCVTTAGSPNITIGPGGSVVLRANTYTSADAIAVGTRICDTITITNPAAAAYYNNPADRIAEDCVTVAKSPYVQFTGGDVWAGGGFAAVAPGTCMNNAKITTVTRSRPLAADGTTPGSGVTYGALALGKITNFGSGSMGQVTATGLGDNWTFANTNTANLGFFNSGQHCIPDYVAMYDGSPTLPSGTYLLNGANNARWRVLGDATFGGGMMPGVTKVYLVDGNATITSNIVHPNVSSADQLPRVVIIAKGNIYVAPGVTQIDGIFITRGTFYTCYPKPEPATINTCNQRLTINGSVSANRVDLFRTGGADGTTPATQKAPAELFNLGPEVYLRNGLNETGGPTITTDQVRELAPRF